ncbi:hypothetical protein [Nonomuraea ceibae]|uniref:hypothetical protein n=1 Tax=Nonomuraea ceibae TaxID=1935170 RepID=UPI001C60467E|nr:hypothetical protein [Nonomuraea ceibae]
MFDLWLVAYAPFADRLGVLPRLLWVEADWLLNDVPSLKLAYATAATDDLCGQVGERVGGRAEREPFSVAAAGGVQILQHARVGPGLGDHAGQGGSVGQVDAEPPTTSVRPGTGR